MGEVFQARNLPAIKTIQFTANLAQAASTYDLCTATTGPVLITGYTLYVVTAGAVFTAVKFTTNQTNATDILTVPEGAVANITAQKILVHAYVAPIYLVTGQKLQYVITGATGSGSILVTLQYYDVTNVGATLA